MPKLYSIEARGTAVTSDINQLFKGKNNSTLIYYDKNAVDFFLSGLTDEQMLSSVAKTRGRITSLDFRGTKVSLKGIAALGVKPHVEEIRLGKMTFAEGILPLVNFPNLKELDLAEAKFNPKFLSQLASAKNLEQINLSHTKLPDEITKYFAQLPNLKVLYLTGSDFSHQALNGLSQNVKVYY